MILSLENLDAGATLRAARIGKCRLRAIQGLPLQSQGARELYP